MPREAPSHASSLAVESAPRKAVVFDNVSLAFEENQVLEGVSFYLEHRQLRYPAPSPSEYVREYLS